MDNIDSYSTCMFKYEYLHDSWIDKCSEYLLDYVGSSLEGKSVIDYAFGRGNWTAAFLRLNVRKVYAIDASIENCNKFSQWLKYQNIENVEVIHGNIMEFPLNITADFVWAHGILHHLEYPSLFIHRLKTLLKDDQSLIHLYAYNSDSLRSIVVDTMRSLYLFNSEVHFREFSYSFTPQARFRVRDDLTAPVVRWFSCDEMTELMEFNKLSIVKNFHDFGVINGNHTRLEFNPFNLLLSPTFSCKHEPSSLFEDTKFEVFHLDFTIIQSMLATIAASINETKSMNASLFVIGLANSYFSQKLSSPPEVLYCQLFLYLSYVFSENHLWDKLSHPSSSLVCDLFLKSLSSQPRSLHHDLEKSLICSYLSRVNVRI